MNSRLLVFRMNQDVNRQVSNNAIKLYTYISAGYTKKCTIIGRKMKQSKSRYKPEEQNKVEMHVNV